MPTVSTVMAAIISAIIPARPTELAMFAIMTVMSARSVLTKRDAIAMDTSKPTLTGIMGISGRGQCQPHKERGTRKNRSPEGCRDGHRKGLNHCDGSFFEDPPLA